MDKTHTEPEFLAALKWTSNGLIPAIVQDVENGDVLMMAWMDKEAVLKTLETGQTYFYSRSRGASWHKGETSGHIQHVSTVHVDCDGDVLLIKARQVGGACHKGFRSCFHRQIDRDGRLQTTSEPVFSPSDVYRGGKSSPT